MEGVATYARIYDVYRAVRSALEPYERDGLTLRIHLSHWYPWGTMIYCRFVTVDRCADLRRLQGGAKRARALRARRPDAQNPPEPLVPLGHDDLRPFCHGR